MKITINPVDGDPRAYHANRFHKITPGENGPIVQVRVMENGKPVLKEFVVKNKLDDLLNQVAAAV